MSSDTHTIRFPLRMRRVARSETPHRADPVTTAQPSEAASQEAGCPASPTTSAFPSAVSSATSPGDALPHNCALSSTSRSVSFQRPAWNRCAVMPARTT